jgi:hypothetical protein
MSIGRYSGVVRGGKVCGQSVTACGQELLGGELRLRVPYPGPGLLA